MGKKIIIAGGGHGGIATGAILAQNGFDVTVYEKNKREDMGYDWTDIFDKKGLFAVGMDMPSEDKYLMKNDMTFINPSMSMRIKQHVAEDQLEIQMERKEIYNHIIAHAENCGVKFKYETPIETPVLLGGRVVGIKTADSVEYADLVIDAAGINSPVRTQLPSAFGIQNKVNEYEQFFVYRGFYNKPCECVGDKFRVYLFFKNRKIICWVADDGDHTDVLIGSFFPLKMEEVNSTLDELRELNPDLGTELERGGQFVNIPIRQPLGVLVADGYAAIGDSAFMTVPLIGSGIANTLKASRVLADTIIADKDELFNGETLWKYQRGFYKLLGNGLAPLASIKLMMTRLEPSELDYIFEHEVLNADDMTIGADSNSLMAMASDMLNPEALKVKIRASVKNPPLLRKIMRLGSDIAKVTATTTAMPLKYDRKLILKWVSSYNSCFKR